MLCQSHWRRVASCLRLILVFNETDLPDLLIALNSLLEYDYYFFIPNIFKDIPRETKHSLDESGIHLIHLLQGKAPVVAYITMVRR